MTSAHLDFGALLLVVCLCVCFEAKRCVSCSAATCNLQSSQAASSGVVVVFVVGHSHSTSWLKLTGVNPQGWTGSFR